MSAAPVAFEWLESGVFPTVRDKVGGLTEGFSAYVTFMRFFTFKIEIMHYSKHVMRYKGITLYMY
jgi:hypothetical protein